MWLCFAKLQHGRGGGMGRATGLARVPSSCISAKESQGVPHKPHGFLLLPLLVAFVFIIE